MSENMVPLDGESQKKRVVSCFISSDAINYIFLTSEQCYFFDSDIGGFHYGPGHP